MPPLTVNRHKAVFDHRTLQQHPVFILLIRDPSIVRVRNLTEQIKRPAHIHFLSGIHVEKGQIHCTAPAVTGLAGNIALCKKLLLLQFRIKIRLHPQIQILDPPQDKMPDRPGRTIGVKNLQTVSPYIYLIADFLQRSRRLFCQQRAGLLISVNALPDKIVRGIIADLLNDSRHIIRQYHKIRRIHDHFLFKIHCHSFFLPHTNVGQTFSLKDYR